MNIKIPSSFWNAKEYLYYDIDIQFILGNKHVLYLNPSMDR